MLKRFFFHSILFLGLAFLVACKSVTDSPPRSVQPGVFQTSIGVIYTDTPPVNSAEPSPSIDQATQPPVKTSEPIITATPAVIRFAVIGDYGQGDQAELDVSDLVKSWNPDFIITTGDNNYPSGSAETIDDRVGKYYHEFISPYSGSFGPGTDRNRFFPPLGNHDWDTAQARAYFDYFTLPGNERYYEFKWEPVHFFALDSDSREPDGVGASTHQAIWLKEQLAVSDATWKVVYGHHPPYTSGLRGPVNWMVWPFKEWGATVYLAGHDHFYERLIIDDFPYIINGSGGGPLYDIGPAVPGSQVRYNSDYGAMLVTANSEQIVFQFITRAGDVIDSYTLSR